MEKLMKQTKAKESQERKKAKVEESASSGPGALAAAPKPAAVKAAPAAKAFQMSTNIVDQTNLDYYTAVQEDSRLVLKTLGSTFVTLPALPIAELNNEGTGGVQARFSDSVSGACFGEFLFHGGKKTVRHIDSVLVGAYSH